MKTRTGYLIKRGKTFYACWTIGARKFRKSTATGDRREAQTALDRIMQPFLIESEVRTLETVRARIEGAKAELVVLDEQRNPPLTIGNAWSAYLETPNRPDTAPSTLKKHAGKVCRFVVWIDKTHPEVTAMRDVSEEIAEAYARDLAGTGMAAATFNAHVGLLRLVWRVLRKKVKTDRNPWVDVGRRRVAAAGRRELTVEELRRVVGASTGETRLLFALGIYTGLRLGDCATLRWGEVDVERSMLRRVPNKTARRNPKTVNVPLHATLRTMLSETAADRRSLYVLPETAEMYLRDASAVCKRIQDHFEACGVRTQRPGTGFTTEANSEGIVRRVHTGKRAIVEVGFHSLRHTFVSLCREANAPLAVVEAMVGHSNPAMTRHYTHTGEAAATAAVAALPSVLGPASPPSLPASRTVTAEAIRAIADRLNAKSWKTVKEELVALTN